MPVLYDGAQSLGQFPVDVVEIGADFYSILVYKWMYGPYSAGALYIDKAWQERLGVVPSSANYFGNEGSRRFEFAAVPPSYYNASASAAAYLTAVGIANIETYVTGLATRLRTIFEESDINEVLRLTRPIPAEIQAAGLPSVPLREAGE